MSRVHGAWVEIHTHENGADCVAAAAARARNTTIIIGADQDKGCLLIDFDVQEGACSGVVELKEQLQLILETLDGQDVEAQMGDGDE